MLTRRDRGSIAILPYHFVESDQGCGTDGAYHQNEIVLTPFLGGDGVSGGAEVCPTNLVFVPPPLAIHRKPHDVILDSHNAVDMSLLPTVARMEYGGTQLVESHPSQTLLDMTGS